MLTMNPELYLDEARGLSDADIANRQAGIIETMQARNVLEPGSPHITTRPNNPTQFLDYLGVELLFAEPVESSVDVHADSIQRVIGRRTFYRLWGLEEPGHGRIYRAMLRNCGVESQRCETPERKVAYSVLGATRHLPKIGETVAEGLSLEVAQAGFINEIVNMVGQHGMIAAAKSIGEHDSARTIGMIRAQEVTHAQWFALDIARIERSLPKRRYGVRAMSLADHTSSGQKPIGANNPAREAHFGRMAFRLTDGNPTDWIESDVRKLAEVVYLPEAAPTSNRAIEHETRVERMLDQYRHCENRRLEELTLAA